ncbi:MAG: DSBA-like thioredoxin protein [Bacteriovoracaceae bacterium]|nr:DSBA-like thioredoxin protein [Bacteriovoracaceae bacterium]
MRQSNFYKFSFLTISALVAMVMLTGCQSIADKYIDSYFDRKGVDQIEKTIDKIVAKKREEARKQEEPSLQERLKNRVNVSIEGAPVKGPANAPVTIVEFSDFECPFCKRVLPSVDEVMKQYNGKVKLAFRNNPLPFHPKAMPAAKAAVAAQNQGKFWEMYDKMFANQQALSEESFNKWAKELKMDVKKFDKDMKDPATQKKIEEDSNFARANGAGGTPSFFINGVLLVGAQPFEKFKEIIDAVMAENTKK